jgi:hypothetical protein
MLFQHCQQHLGVDDRPGVEEFHLVSLRRRVVRGQAKR